MSGEHAWCVLTFLCPTVDVAWWYLLVDFIILFPRNFFEYGNDSSKWALIALWRLVFLTSIAFFSCKNYSLFIRSLANIFQNSSYGLSALWCMQYASAILTFTSVIVMSDIENAMRYFSRKSSWIGKETREGTNKIK